MKEKVLGKKKNGIAMMFLFILLYIASIALIIVGGISLEQTEGVSVAGIIMLAVGCVYACIGWIPFLGIKVLKPQEALVLTLFGKYVGTLKSEGCYWVNPFCSAVNPASKTRLKQSGDVAIGAVLEDAKVNTSAQSESKKISLKIMTLNNNRQKINDCLGNPVEIGIAVMWRVQDTGGSTRYPECLSLPLE